MKKLLIALLTLILCLTAASAALADRMYIFPDSDVRRLTREEVCEWDYESLGFAFHELLARHGYVFDPNGNYFAYFNAQPWYTPNANPDNSAACYPRLSSLEWENYNLIKEVRAEKRLNDYGRSIWTSLSFTVPSFALDGFQYIELQGNQVFPVYSAPSTEAWRGANGRAEVSTNGAIYSAGTTGGWTLVMYETNSGGVRVGYIRTSMIQGPLPAYVPLQLNSEPATVIFTCTLTDDPARSGSTITTLYPGDTVTLLATYSNFCDWNYVEASVKGQIARGFIPAGYLMIDAGAQPLEEEGFSDAPVLLD